MPTWKRYLRPANSGRRCWEPHILRWLHTRPDCCCCLYFPFQTPNRSSMHTRWAADSDRADLGWADSDRADWGWADSDRAGLDLADLDLADLGRADLGRAGRRLCQD